MAGDKCVAIGSDLRFGVQMQTMATDYQKVMQVRILALCFASRARFFSVCFSSSTDRRSYVYCVWGIFDRLLQSL